MHCPSCKSLIQRTVSGIEYCPSLDCELPKGAHDWEVVPIILQMAQTQKLWEAIGLVQRSPAPVKTEPRFAPRHCWKCGSTLKEARGFGLYCPDNDCEVVDEVGCTREQFRRTRVGMSGTILARALRRNRS